MKTVMRRLLCAVAATGLLALSAAAPAQADDTGLDGTVTDKLTGAPVPGAGIAIEHPDGSGWEFANSDEQGRFDFPTASGEYLVRVLANGYVEQWLYGQKFRELADLITAPATIQVQQMPIQYGAVAGRVVSQQGRGVANVHVELRRDDNWVGDASTDSRGRFSFPRVETDSTYTAVFTFPAGQVIWYGGVDWPEAIRFTVSPDATTTVNLTRPPVGDLVIRVVDAETGEAIPYYCFYPQDGPFQWNTFCADATGRAGLRDMTVGEYFAGGYDPDGIYANAHFGPVTITEGDTTRVRLQLERSANPAAAGRPVTR